MGKLKTFGAITGIVAKAGGRALLKCRKYSPEILLVGGIVCGVAAVVTAVIATKKTYEDEKLHDIEDELEDLESELKEEEDKEVRKEMKKRALKLWVKKVLRCLRLYILPIALTVAMICFKVGSFNIIKARYLTATAAYTALDSSFKSYRERVRDIVGEEKEQKFFDGTDDVEIKSVDEEGNESTKTVQQRKPGISKKYAPWEFDFNKETSPFRATTDSDHNMMELRAIEQWANDRLHAIGYLFLNEVLEELGIERTTEGQLLGWCLDGNGDGYVDFGIKELYSDRMSDILDGNVPNVHLCFNCDGLIYEMI